MRVSLHPRPLAVTPRRAGSRLLPNGAASKLSADVVPILVRARSYISAEVEGPMRASRARPCSPA
jgi:hypothetical protein